MYDLIVVDDEPRSVESIVSNVDWKMCGIRNVYTALSMEEAINVIKQHKIDILICDIEMPNGTGLNLLEWLQASEYNISCVFVTCHPEFEYMRKAIQLNCYDYVLKPIHYQEFERVVDGLVRKMEASVKGDKEAISVNWGGITDYDIHEYAKVEKERDVEAEVKKYIREHMNETINICDVADELHFNPHYLMRSFKNKTGLSIMKYITKIRLDTSKKLLAETQLSIKEIASLSGYSDYSYFTRVFRKETGISPTKYRNTVSRQTE